MRLSGIRNLSALASVGILAAALMVGTSPVYAQSHSGGGRGGGHSSGTEHVDSDHGGSAGQRGGPGMSRGGANGGQSLRDIFHEMESGATTEQRGGSASSTRGKRGSASTTTRGNKGTAATQKGKTAPKAAEEEGPGRGGNVASGTKKGDTYGDMYVLLRDENGVPILKPLPDGTFAVQPVDAEGNPLPLDEEGNLIDASQAIPVDLGRLNVGRSPLTVLSAQYEEALNSINEADSVSVDASGRLVLTTDGVTAAIDSPLENLALYVELLNTGTITGVTDPSKFDSSISYLVDGTKTTVDLTSAAAFLAAAADKTGTLSVDKVVDMNTILGITGTLTDASGATYVDYSSFTYDRETVYGDTTVQVLVKQEDGSYLPTTVNVYDAVFNSTEYTGTNVAGFTQAADDALQVIEYVHDNSVPETN